VVLDPFMGSGQTAIAAIMDARHYVGYEIDKNYVELSERRIRQYLNENLKKSLQIPLLTPSF